MSIKSMLRVCRFPGALKYSQNELLFCGRNEPCAICAEEHDISAPTEQPNIVLQCGHYFHAECLLTWLAINKECPLCRSEVTDESFVPRSECEWLQQLFGTNSHECSGV